jgi:putative tricarboxylic transport membrane protein
MSGVPEPRREERRPDRAALFIAVLLMAIAALVAWDTSKIGGAGGYARIGPATVPYIVAIGLAGLSVWTAIEAVRGGFPEREPQESAPILWIVGGLAAQMLLLDVAGFSIATGVLFACVARGFGRREFWISLPAGIVFAFLAWIVFARGLRLSLPAGPLERLFF